MKWPHYFRGPLADEGLQSVFIGRKQPPHEWHCVEPQNSQQSSYAAAAEGALSALEKLQYRLRQLVRLRDHRRSSLLQDLGARQVGGFHREISILNA